jgi:hypothetical protein
MHTDLLASTQTSCSQKLLIVEVESGATRLQITYCYYCCSLFQIFVLSNNADFAEMIKLLTHFSLNEQRFFFLMMLLTPQDLVAEMQGGLLPCWV